MSDPKSRAICVGEVMIELLRESDGRFAIACGGDTFNTAVYLARAGADVGFATALGDDPYSDGIMALIAAEGVASEAILRVNGRLPGLYVVDLDPAGKQHFNFWRAEAPARDLFELPDWNRVAASLRHRQAHLLLRHHALALFQYRARPLPRLDRGGAAERRQDRVRRQLPSPRLAGRPVTHPHRFHGSVEAGRYRAAGLRRRGGAVGRSEPGGHGRADAGLRHRRDRGEERPQQRAGGDAGRPANSFRCRNWSCRSTPWRPATASTPATWRRGSPAKPRRRRPPPRIASPAR